MPRFVFELKNKRGDVLLYDESEPNEGYLGFWKRCMNSIMAFKKARSAQAPMPHGFTAEIEELYEGEVVKSWAW